MTTVWPSEIVCRGDIEATALPFDRRAAYRFLKIRLTSPRLSAFDAMIDDCLVACQRSVVPRFVYALVRVPRADPAASVVEVEGYGDTSYTFSSQGLAKALQKASGAAFFALTLGEELDELLERITVEDFTTAYVTDGVASALVHGLLSVLEEELATAAAVHSLCLGKRFSPGFHKWDLTQQKDLFEILDPGSIGMQLSESQFMTPRHSLSGVYALLPADVGVSVSTDPTAQSSS